MLSAGLSFIDTSYVVGAVSKRLLRVEGSMFASHSLHKDLGVFVDENVGLGLLGVDTPLHGGVQEVL
jgi:hypothetical protein